MWNWFNCYLSGRHAYGITCSDGSIYLRCIHCGKRSEGWNVHGQRPQTIAPAHRPVETKPAQVKAGRPLPFAPREVARQQRSA
jgi:hypothetical protein